MTVVCHTPGWVHAAAHMNTSSLTDPVADLAHALNLGCYCRTLDETRLRHCLEGDAGLAGLAQEMARTRPHLFSSTAVFLSEPMAGEIRQTVAALERIMALEPYQTQALQRAPATAGHHFGPLGMFMGYDFHIVAGGPRLIEINTNAGGAFLNAVLAEAQQSCCDTSEASRPRDQFRQTLHATYLQMFEAEWHLQRGERPLGFVAIVDDAPDQQYLAPDFELCRRMLERHGWRARTVDAVSLVWRDGRLWAGTDAVDMVYNRLTDFYLTDPAHQSLRQAYEAGAVVLSPHPRAHALHAEKRNLVALSDEAQLLAWGVEEADRKRVRAAVPKTVQVTAERADALWQERRHWFFKPEAGYGGKAVYRGDKLTKRVWSSILSGGYVAQAMVPPGERLIEKDGVRADLKFDIRAYTYGGRVQLLAARMYAGQTTNFRTPGGGFAPVVIVP